MKINKKRFKDFKKLWKQYLIDEFGFTKEETKDVDEKDWIPWENEASNLAESECCRKFCDWLLRKGLIPISHKIGGKK